MRASQCKNSCQRKSSRRFKSLMSVIRGIRTHGFVLSYIMQILSSVASDEHCLRLIFGVDVSCETVMSRSSSDRVLIMRQNGKRCMLFRQLTTWDVFIWVFETCICACCMKEWTGGLKNFPFQNCYRSVLRKKTVRFKVNCHQQRVLMALTIHWLNILVLSFSSWR